MSKYANLFRFFDKVETTYTDMLEHIQEGLRKEQHYIETSCEEVNFLLRLIAALHLNSDYETDPVRTQEVLQELLNGGHLNLKDDGKFYDELVNHFNSSINKRLSSHHSVAQQYSLSYPISKEVLFGVTEDSEGKKRTWIQFEKHDTKNLLNIILHLIDYIKYRITGKNIGPFGSSEHTDSNPLVITRSMGAN
ncbi:MAG: hypothetical protein P4L79_09575 [Legionella sp.]|uniref:hypothetical protein n=1 Tax=Legionella sp. TaxID=459 RepID=UPI00284C201D|nr:hypothetical protein [Legionella sp.]